MDINIKDKFANRRPTIIGIEECREAAVCICLVPGGTEEAGPEIVFEVRAMNIGQPGDICFPGGRLELGESPAEAAVREVCEELLVDSSQIEIIGEGDKLLGKRRLIHVFIAELRDYKGTYNRDEVQEVFQVPVQFFLDNEPEVYMTEYKIVDNDDFPYDRIVGGRQYQWKDRMETVVFYKYKERNIWGVTGKILESFAKILGDE